MFTKTGIKDVYQGAQVACLQQAVTMPEEWPSTMALNVGRLINLLFLNLIGTVIPISAHFFPLFPN